VPSSVIPCADGEYRHPLRARSWRLGPGWAADIRRISAGTGRKIGTERVQVTHHSGASRQNFNSMSQPAGSTATLGRAVTGGQTPRGQAKCQPCESHMPRDEILNGGHHCKRAAHRGRCSLPGCGESMSALTPIHPAHPQPPCRSDIPPLKGGGLSERCLQFARTPEDPVSTAGPVFDASCVSRGDKG
jgi:hypothetical protein